MRSLLLLPMLLAACADSDAVDLGILDQSLAPDLAGDLAKPSPDMTLPAPKPGVLIDRMGRLGIATLLIDPFDFDGARAATRDRYNHADPSTAPAEFTSVIADSLALYDILDDQCGTQAPIRPVKSMNGDYPATAYSKNAALFADDQLYVNTASGKCENYHGVEDAVIGGAELDDCGGRTPGYVPLTVSYTDFGGVAKGPISDGVDGNTGNPSSSTEFPFFGAPNM